MNSSDFIMHYASEYYDPVKAHQYYEEHKKLKGRHSTKGFTQNQHEAWQYAKNELNEEKKVKSDTARSERQSTSQALRDSAQKTREEIMKKILDKIEEINNMASKEKDQLGRIAVPKNASKSQREAIARENARRSEAKKEITENANSEKTNVRSSGKSEREALSASLKEAIGNTREKCTATLAKIKEEYETKLDREYENISKKVR